MGDGVTTSGGLTGLAVLGVGQPMVSTDGARETDSYSGLLAFPVPMLSEPKSPSLLDLLELVETPPLPLPIIIMGPVHLS